jgi:NADH-quinone oxidoreductase subunit M
MLYTLILLLVSIFALFFIFNNNYARWYSFYVSLIVFIQIFFISFSKFKTCTRFPESVGDLADFADYSDLILTDLSRGLVLLTVFIMPLIFSSIWENINFRLVTVSLISLLSIEFFLILSFLAVDLLIFYVAFESLLIPMVIVVAVFGGRSQKIKALYYLFFFTLVGSVFLLVSIMIILTDTAGWLSGNGVLLSQAMMDSTHALNFTLSWLTLDVQNKLWLPFFIAFCIKVPSFPFHIWLPAAHVEAPTFGSVILAALLLKLGGYGILQFIVPVFSHPFIIAKYWPVVVLCGVSSVLFASLVAARQVDAKRIVAYSSIAHMNLGLLGMFSNNLEGVLGSYHLMIAHGFVSASMFFIIGILYDRSHSRLIEHYSGLAVTMPLFSSIMLLATFANIGFPGTYNFLGEFATLLGLFKQQPIVAFLAGLGTIGAAIYSILLLNKIIYGFINTLNTKLVVDIEANEFFIQFTLLFVTLIFGLNFL